MEDQIVEDLTLLLLHLTSWEERVYEGRTIRRARNGFRFEVLDALQEAGCLNHSRGAKSLTLTEAGIEHVRALAASYLG